MPTTDTKQESRKQVAERAAQKMFVNGAGEKADRLVLVQESHSGAAKITNAKDLGGWSVWPLADTIEAALKARDERAAKIVNDARLEGESDLRSLAHRIKDENYHV